MSGAPLAPAEKDRRLRRRAVWGIFIFAMALATALRVKLLLGYPDIEFPLGPPNPDVWLRLTQVRQWLTGGGFFNHGVLHTNAPFGGVTTPWTRPIDIILSILYFLTPPHFAPTMRVMLAAAGMAPAFCVLALFFMARTARRHLDHSHVLVATALLTIFNAYLGHYFSPGDADHHGFMSMLWCGVLYLITADAMTGRNGFIAGLLLGGITWVSPEGLLLAGPVYALLGLETLFKPQKMPGLAAMTCGAALLVSGALFVERPLSDITQPYYDTLSVVHVVLLWLVAVAALLLTGIYRRGASFGRRVFTAALAAVAVALAMYGLYPKFFKGPMVDVDPFIFTHFLPRVTEAQPLFKSPWPEIILALGEPLVAVLLLINCFRHGWRDMRPRKRRYLLLLAALFVYTMLLTLCQIRWEYYVQPLAIVLCAALLPGTAMGTRAPKRPPRQWRPYAWLAVVFALTDLGAMLAPAHNRVLDVLCMSEVRYALQTQQLQPLLGDKDMVVYLTANAGGDALYFTPYGIIASNYHREGAGLKDMFALENAQNAFDAYRILHARHVEAMFYCPGDYNAKAWIRTVTQTKKYPRWMVPVNAKLKFFDYKDVEFPKPMLFRVKP